MPGAGGWGAAIEGETAPLLKRQIAAVVTGNALEFYDFVTYAFFAVQIGQVFFPGHDPFASLMLSLATFGVGFAARPLGGVVLGRYADRVGRKPAMLLSFVLMGAAILGLAIVPPYAAIGVAAPILVVLARLVQGFALGGEVGSSTSFLLEASPPGKRGLMTSWQGASQYIASTAGGIVGIVVSTTLSAQHLQQYGWRIAFALGALTLPFAMLVRRGLPETLHLKEPHTDEPALVLLRRNLPVILKGLAALGSGTIATYIGNYTTTYAQTTLHMPAPVAFAATLSIGVCAFFGCLAGGALSDRVGRWPVMVWPKLAQVLLTYPIYLWIVTARSGVALLVGIGILSFLTGSIFAAVAAGLAEALPKPIRSLTLSTVYASAIAVFGGTAQPITAWLIHVTDDPLAPSWYLIASGVIGLAAMATMRETAPLVLARRAPPRG